MHEDRPAAHGRLIHAALVVAMAALGLVASLPALH